MAETSAKSTTKKATTKASSVSAKPATKKAAASPVKEAAKPVTKKAVAKPVAATKKPVASKSSSGPAKAAAKAQPKAIVISDEQRYRMVAEAAYYRAESNQFKSDPLRDWIEAEQDITALLNGSK